MNRRQFLTTSAAAIATAVAVPATMAEETAFPSSLYIADIRQIIHDRLSQEVAIQMTCFGSAACKIDADGYITEVFESDQLYWLSDKDVTSDENTIPPDWKLEEPAPTKHG